MSDDRINKILSFLLFYNKYYPFNRLLSVKNKNYQNLYSIILRLLLKKFLYNSTIIILYIQC